MPWSDLNLVVTFRNRSLSERDVLKHVERFHHNLLRHPEFVTDSEFGERKNISILKFRCSPLFFGKRVEVIFRRAMAQNLPKNESIISGYLETYPIARELYLVVRRILHAAELDDPADGGINTLASFLLVIAFIQKIESSASTGEPPLSKPRGSTRSADVTTCVEAGSLASDLDPPDAAPALRSYLNPHKLGETFLNLLYFYGHMFDFGTNFIRTYVSRFSKSHPFCLKADTSLNSLMILNPFDHNLIITKSFKRTAHLKQTFKLLYNHHFALCHCAAPSISPLHTPSTTALVARTRCQDDLGAGGSGEALLVSLRPRGSFSSGACPPPASGAESEPSEPPRLTKGRSRLSSKSMVFAKPSAGPSLSDAGRVTSAPSTLLASFAYSFPCP